MTQLASGSISTRTALKNRLIGTARSAPSGPSTQAQNTSETNVRVVDRPTACPTTRGWITDWMIRFTTEYMTMTAIIRLGPPSSSAINAGGTRPMTKPMLGMKLVTNASTPQTKAAGTPIA